MGRREHYTDDQIRQWYKEYADGLTTMDIEAKYGISKSRFAKRCLLLGLELRHAGRKSPYIERNLAILGAYANHEPVASIAARFYLTPSAIYQIVQTYARPLKIGGYSIEEIT